MIPYGRSNKQSTNEPYEGFSRNRHRCYLVLNWAYDCKYLIKLEQFISC